MLGRGWPRLAGFCVIEFLCIFLASGHASVGVEACREIIETELCLLQTGEAVSKREALWPPDEVDHQPRLAKALPRRGLPVAAQWVIGILIALFTVAISVGIYVMAPSGEGGFGSRSIGLFGSVMLLTNNVAGPTVSLMPGLTQDAGWLVTIILMLVIAGISAACGYMLLYAISCMPGNKDLSRRVEFADVMQHYLHRWVYYLAMVCYIAYLVLTLMTYIIQTGQVIDYAFMDGWGCAFGLDFGKGFVCEHVRNSSTPFGQGIVLPLSFVLVAVICSPMASKNLDDSILAQVIAIIGLSILATIWLALLGGQPDFPVEGALPAAGSGARELFGTMLFNFAFLSSLPSWASEKKPEVSVGLVFGLTLAYVVVVYTAIGIVGALAFPPFRGGDENLFSKLNASGGWLGTTSVLVYPILQNFTSIPVFAIILRYNFLRLGWLPRNMATAVSMSVPFILSIFFYTGRGFHAISQWGGLVFSVVVNYAIPVILFILASRSFWKDDGSAPTGKDDDGSAPTVKDDDGTTPPVNDDNDSIPAMKDGGAAPTLKEAQPAFAGRKEHGAGAKQSIQGAHFLTMEKIMRRVLSFPEEGPVPLAAKWVLGARVAMLIYSIFMCAYFVGAVARHKFLWVPFMTFVGCLLSSSGVPVAGGTVYFPIMTLTGLSPDITVLFTVATQVVSCGILTPMAWVGTDTSVFIKPAFLYGFPGGLLGVVFGTWLVPLHGDAIKLFFTIAMACLLCYTVHGLFHTLASQDERLQIERQFVKLQVIVGGIVGGILVAYIGIGIEKVFFFVLTMHGVNAVKACISGITMCGALCLITTLGKCQHATAFPLELWLLGIPGLIVGSVIGPFINHALGSKRILAIFVCLLAFDVGKHVIGYITGGVHHHQVQHLIEGYGSQPFKGT